MVDRTRRIIRATGEEIPIAKPLSLRKAASLIGAVDLDVVSLPALGKPLMVMLVNDKGWETREERTLIPGRGERIRIIPVRPLLPINEKATALYRANRLDSTHQIAGDVVIVPDLDPN